MKKILKKKKKKSSRKKSKTEGQFNTELGRSAQILYPGTFWRKWDDSPTKAQRPKPFDITWFVGGRAIAIESKVHKSHTAWPLSKVRDHQIDGLLEVESKASGGNAFILLNVRFGLGTSRVNRVFVFEPQDIVNLRIHAKSLTLDDLYQFPTLEWVKDKSSGELVWSISRLIDDIPPGL